MQNPKMFIGKIKELIETIMVRHGLMVVGSAQTGKTALIKILAAAIGQLYEEGSRDFLHKVVVEFRMNPKSVSLQELFGSVNVLTKEWTDGIVSKLMKEAVEDKEDTKKWFVFDGPVDTLWIESMNTVLDDNKMLCLANGQRIKIPNSFIMMFEVQDLSKASPATVSRCGMVYIEPVHLGWRPLLTSWAKNFREAEKVKVEIPKGDDDKKGEAEEPEYTIPAETDVLIALIEEFFDKNYVHMRKNYKGKIKTTDMNLL